jgi:hypothetical protein
MLPRAQPRSDFRFRHSLNVAGHIQVWPSVPLPCSDSGWSWPGVARYLPTLAPHLAPRSNLAPRSSLGFANVRLIERSIDLILYELRALPLGRQPVTRRVEPGSGRAISLARHSPGVVRRYLAMPARSSHGGPWSRWAVSTARRSMVPSGSIRVTTTLMRLLSLREGKTAQRRSMPDADRTKPAMRQIMASRPGSRRPAPAALRCFCRWELVSVTCRNADLLGLVRPNLVQVAHAGARRDAVSRSGGWRPA